MTPILDNITIPEQGMLEVKLNLTIEIKVTAEQARKKVDHWLMDQVSSQMGAETPTLVVGERTVWRVPAYLSFPDTGRIQGIGTYDIDVVTGEMIDLDTQKEKMMDHLEREVRPRLPLYRRPIREVPSQYIAADAPPTKNLIVDTDGQVKAIEGSRFCFKSTTSNKVNAMNAWRSARQ